VSVKDENKREHHPASTPLVSSFLVVRSNRWDYSEA